MTIVIKQPNRKLLLGLGISAYVFLCLLVLIFTLALFVFDIAEGLGIVEKVTHRKCPNPLPPGTSQCLKIEETNQMYFFCDKDQKVRRYNKGDDPCGPENPVIPSCTDPMPENAVSCKPVQDSELVVEYACKDGISRYNSCSPDAFKVQDCPYDPKELDAKNVKSCLILQNDFLDPPRLDLVIECKDGRAVDDITQCMQPNNTTN